MYIRSYSISHHGKLHGVCYDGGFKVADIWPTMIPQTIGFAGLGNEQILASLKSDGLAISVNLLFARQHNVAEDAAFQKYLNDQGADVSFCAGYAIPIVSSRE